MTARFASLSYSRSTNLGDDIQSIASGRFLPQIDTYLDRDALDDAVDGGPFITMMNGWFLEDPQHWPPGPAIVPVLTGFHITSTNTSAERLIGGGGGEYLRRNQPIGCRDYFTRDLLIHHGIEAEYIGCPTITFAPRGSAPDADRIFLVQTEGIRVPATLSRDAIRVDQRVASWASPAVRRQLASELLDMYRRRARLVITTKLHCALPCAAMGIPVVLLGDPTDPRLTPAAEAIGVNEFRADRLASTRRARLVRRRENTRISSEVDWDPPVKDLRAIQERVSRDVAARVQQAIDASA